MMDYVYEGRDILKIKEFMNLASFKINELWYD